MDLLIIEKSALGLAHGQTRLAAPNTRWPELFRAEAARLREAMPPGVTPEIAHVGSTAVPDLPAKPIIDMAVSAPAGALAAVAEALAGLGYLDRGTRSGRLFIRLRAGHLRTHAVDLYAEGDPGMAGQIAFRDALREDQELRAAYARKKTQIIRAQGGRRPGMAEAKTSFIREAIAQARP